MKTILTLTLALFTCGFAGAAERPNIFLTLLTITGIHAEPTGKPNILFIFADDIGYEALNRSAKAKLEAVFEKIKMPPR